MCDKTGKRVLNHIRGHEEILEAVQLVDSPFIDGFTTVPSPIVFQLSGYGTYGTMEASS